MSRSEEQFPRSDVEWVSLLVFTALVSAFSLFLTLAWTRYHKNRSLLGYSLRHVFLGNTISELAILLGAGDGFSLDGDSPLCRVQSVSAVFGNLYLAQWILGIMIMTYRQTSKNRFVPRMAMQRNYNQIRLMAVCVSIVLAVPSAFFQPVPVGQHIGTLCLPGEPLAIRIGLFGAPLLLTGVATIVFTAAVMVRTKRLFCTSFGGETNKLPDGKNYPSEAGKALNENNSPNGAKVSPQNQESSPQHQQVCETTTSCNFTTDRSSITYAIDSTQEYWKPSLDNGEAKNGNVANRPCRSKSFDFFTLSSSKTDESFDLPVWVNTRRLSPTHSRSDIFKHRSIPMRHHSAPPQHFGAPMKSRIRPNDGSECNPGSSIQPPHPRRQSAQSSRRHCPSMGYGERVAPQGKQKQGGFDRRMSSSNNGGSHTKGFSSECAIHHGKMTDMPRRSDEQSSYCALAVKRIWRRLRKLCVNPRVTAFAILSSVRSIAFGATTIAIGSLQSTQEESSENEDAFYHINDALAWYTVLCGLSAVLLFLTHSSMKSLLKGCCQAGKTKNSRNIKVSPGLHVAKTSGSSIVKTRVRRTQSQV